MVQDFVRTPSGPVRDYLELNATSNHDALLKAADDLSASTAWGVIDAQRQQWLAALPRNLSDLLSWLTGQDPGTTLLDLLAFCTGTLLDGITGTEGPHAINALSNALHLDMTRYWTPTRATYFDHVSKSRIVDVAMQAVSPKVALELSKMKKEDASAMPKCGWQSPTGFRKSSPIGKCRRSARSACEAPWTMRRTRTKPAPGKQRHSLMRNPPTKTSLHGPTRPQPAWRTRKPRSRLRN